MAKMSHTSGDLKFAHRPRTLGYGATQYANHARPRCSTGNRPAVMTANTVMASDARYTALRQPERNRNRIALIRVPLCAMPTQNTNVVMYVPQNTGGV